PQFGDYTNAVNAILAPTAVFRHWLNQDLSSHYPEWKAMAARNPFAVYYNNNQKELRAGRPSNPLFPYPSLVGCGTPCSFLRHKCSIRAVLLHSSATCRAEVVFPASGMQE